MNHRALIHFQSSTVGICISLVLRLPTPTYPKYCFLGSSYFRQNPQRTIVLFVGTKLFPTRSHHPLLTSIIINLLIIILRSVVSLHSKPKGMIPSTIVSNKEVSLVYTPVLITFSHLSFILLVSLGFEPSLPSQIISSILFHGRMDRFPPAPRVLRFDENDDDISCYTPSFDSSDTETVVSSNDVSEVTIPSVPTSLAIGPLLLKYHADSFVLPPYSNSETESLASIHQEKQSLTVAVGSTKYLAESSNEPQVTTTPSMMVLDQLSS
jgi:hypothetical protein